MNNVKRMIIAAVILVLTGVLVFGSGNNQTQGSGAAAAASNSNFNPTGYPIVKDKITLTGFGNQNVTHRNWDELYCFNEYENKSNIHIQWTTAPNQGFAERKNVLLASGDYPDFFYRCALTIADQINYGSKGALISLNKLIDQYGVNLKDDIKELPDMGKAITMPDGNIYALPSKPQISQSSSPYNWINKRWLDNLGLKVPTTLGELETVLTAFKTQDANGNGNPNDEIPYSDRTLGASIFSSTYSAFGIGSLGNVQYANYIDLGDDGRIRLFAISDNFRQQLEWLAGLYAKGLMDPEMFTQDIPTFTAKGEQDLIGAFFFNNTPDIIGSKYNDFVTTPPFKGNYGPAVDNNIGVPFNLGAFAISNQNKYPAETMRWIDYYYGYEGSLLIRLGQEGVTYIKNPDGSYALTDLITKNPNGLNMPQAIGQYAIGFAGGGCPEFAREEFERARLPSVVFDSYDIIKPYISVKALPMLSFTTAEQDQLNALTDDIVTYITEQRIQFVTGRRPLSQWNSYVNDIKNMGADRYVALYQASWDRYSK
ncbi:MAG: extracellular solute-binding protein [Treponema sp.]|nr:extracellular solute-binding protein [Treponema sp.]